MSDIRKVMTAGQLIEILKKHRADLPVLVEGYETGFDPIHSIVPAKAIPNPQNQDYDGEYEKDGQGSDCLLILGKSEYRRGPSYDAGWENAPAVGREFGADPLRDHLDAREDARRSALRNLKNDRDYFGSIDTLKNIAKLDKKHPLGEAAHLTIDLIRASVPNDGRVHWDNIPEPWRTRFDKASGPSSRPSLDESWGHDWEKFLRLWGEEHEQLRKELNPK